MAVDTVTDQLDTYLSISGAVRSRSDGRRRADGRLAKRSPTQRATGSMGAGKVALTHPRQQAEDAPIGVPGPHQKCFLEGPPQFLPPSPRYATMARSA